MGWFILAQLFSRLVAFISIGRLSELEKDQEILLLRQQVSILMRNHDQTIHPTPVEKLTLAVFAAKLKGITNRSTKELREFIRLFQPETVCSGIESRSAVGGPIHTKGEAEDHGVVRKLKI